MHELGCELDEHTYQEIFDECDSDGDGHLVFAEFITMIGMLKRNVLEVMQLEQSFTRMRAHRLKPPADGTHAPTHPTAHRGGGGSGGGGGPSAYLRRPSEALGPPPTALLNEHAVYASDLVHCLGITEAEAEEMIFIADLKDDPKNVEPSIDFTEFKQAPAHQARARGVLLTAAIVCAILCFTPARASRVQVVVNWSN